MGQEIEDLEAWIERLKTANEAGAPAGVICTICQMIRAQADAVALASTREPPKG